MSMAASGKSTFARNNEFYSGYRVVDYAVHLPPQRFWVRLLLYLSRPFPPLRRALRNVRDMRAIDRRNYFAGVLQMMREHDGPIAVLGRRLPEDFRRNPAFDAIAVGLVLIPEERHRENVRSRRKEMRNPFPFMHHWTTDFEKVREVREEMRDFARRHGVPVFDDFPTAIERLAAAGAPKAEVRIRKHH
jgi:hypothetical protein